MPSVPHLYSFAVNGVLRNTILRINNAVSSSRLNKKDPTYAWLNYVVLLNAALYNSSLLLSDMSCTGDVVTGAIWPHLTAGSFIGLTGIRSYGKGIAGNIYMMDSAVHISHSSFKDTAVEVEGGVENSTVVVTNTTAQHVVTLCADCLKEKNAGAITDSRFYLQDILSTFVEGAWPDIGYVAASVNGTIRGNTLYLLNCTGAHVPQWLPGFSDEFVQYNVVRGDRYTTIGNITLYNQSLWEHYVGEGVGAMFTGSNRTISNNSRSDEICIGGTYRNDTCVCSSVEEKGTYCVSNNYYDEVYLSDAFTSTTLPPAVASNACERTAAIQAKIILLLVLLYTLLS